MAMEEGFPIQVGSLSVARLAIFHQFPSLENHEIKA